MAEIDYDIKHKVIAQMKECVEIQKFFSVLNRYDDTLRGIQTEIIYTSQI